MLIKAFPGLASKVNQICQISRSYVLKILSYAQKPFLHINEETLALSHLSGMSYKNENSFSRWIIEKSDGLTMLGLQKLSETVRDYTYLILQVKPVQEVQSLAMKCET